MTQNDRNIPAKKSSTEKIAFRIIGILVALIIILIVAAVMLIRSIIGNNGANSPRNIKWVKELNETFPDDEFTYVGYDRVGVVGLGSFRNKNVIVVKSKKYPDHKVTMGWNEDHTRIVTDYNYIRYRDEINEYYKNIFSQYIHPDEMKLDFYIVFKEKTELKDYSLEEYIEDHKDVGTFTLHTKYNGSFPSEEEMTKAFDSIIDELDAELDLTVHLSHDSVEPLQTTEGNERYVLMMESPTRITMLNHYIITWKETKTHKKSRQDIIKEIYKDKDI